MAMRVEALMQSVRKEKARNDVGSQVQTVVTTPRSDYKS